MRIERAVVDTNVLISAALSPRSAPAQIVDCLLQYATLVFSRETFEEFETRLWRPKFDRYLDMERRRLILHDFAAAAQWIDLPAGPRPGYSRDPDDDMFLHAALRGKAEWLISGDKDLLELPPADWGFEILSPTQALVSCLTNSNTYLRRLNAPCSVANPRDSYGYRCGLRLA